MKYTIQQFTELLASDRPPADLDAPLLGLWWDAKGDWDKAHQCVDHLDDPASMRVHAYLHRKEGDLGNAGYWYRRTGRRAPDLSLEAEYIMLLRDFLAV